MIVIRSGRSYGVLAEVAVGADRREMNQAWWVQKRYLRSPRETCRWKEVDKQREVGAAERLVFQAEGASYIKTWRGQSMGHLGNSKQLNKTLITILFGWAYCCISSVQSQEMDFKPQRPLKSVLKRAALHIWSMFHCYISSVPSETCNTYQPVNLQLSLGLKKSRLKTGVFNKTFVL